MKLLLEYINQVRAWLSNQGFTPGESDQIIGGLVLAVVIAIGSSIIIAWRLGAWSLLIWLAKKITKEKSSLLKSKKPLNPNIPPDAIDFISRSDKNGQNLLEFLTKTLNPQRNKFVILWGEGGVGKTTLAKETARNLIPIYGNRIVFSSAEGKDQLYTFSTLLEDIAKHFQREDVLQLAPDDKTNTIQQIISESPTLIVLDNFETIINEEQQKCAYFLLRKSPFPALITTRDVHELPQAIPIHIEAMTTKEAEQFLQQITSPYDETTFLPEIIQQIMKQAERIPLVMEWLVEQIRQARKVETVFADLKKGKGKAAERIFARSFRLPYLGIDGQTTLLALSIFSPSASRDALTSVAGFGNNEIILEESLRKLMNLRLIKASDNNSRFSIQGLTRELAQSYLINNTSMEQKEKPSHRKLINRLFNRKSPSLFQAREFNDRFIHYFFDFVRKNSQHTAKDYDNLESEKDNLLMAISLSFDSQNWKYFFPLTAELAHCSVGMLSIRGYWNELILYAERALNVAHNIQDKLQIAYFTHSLAVSYGNMGNVQKAEEFYLDSLKIFKGCDDLIAVARILQDLATSKIEQHKYKEARKFFAESIELHNKLGRKDGLAGCYLSLGSLEIEEGNFLEAEKFLTKSFTIFEDLDDQIPIAFVHIKFGVLERLQSRYEKAELRFFQGLRIYKQYGHQSGIAETLFHIGILRQEQNKKDEAINYMQQSFDIFSRLGSPFAKIILTSLNKLKNDDETKK